MPEQDLREKIVAIMWSELDVDLGCGDCCGPKVEDRSIQKAADKIMELLSK